MMKPIPVAQRVGIIRRPDIVGSDFCCEDIFWSDVVSVVVTFGSVAATVHGVTNVVISPG